jgi:predicted DNA-binding protein with PD1-like motif
MPEASLVESGRTGRIAYARVAPNEDLVRSVEQLCAAQGFRHAFVRGSLGSLIDACLARADGSCELIRGPAAEVVSLAGEVRPQADGAPRATLHGMVVDSEGRVFGGPFVAGANPVLVTFELTLEEWLPDAAS